MSSRPRIGRVFVPATRLNRPLAPFVIAPNVRPERDGIKLSQCAEKNWRRLRGFDYLAKVIAGRQFKDGIEVTEVDQVAA